MSDERLREAYQRLLGDRAGTPADVSLERIVALVEGTGPEEERLETLNDVMSNETLRAEFELLRAAAEAADGEESGGASGATDPARAPTFTSRTRILQVAAAAVLAVGVGVIWQQTRTTDGEAMRSAESDVVLVEPGAESGAAPTFVWRPVPGATEYRLEVLTRAGAVAVDATTADTTYTVPEASALEEGASYVWWVTATLPGGVERRAAARPLTVR